MHNDSSSVHAFRLLVHTSRSETEYSGANSGNRVECDPERFMQCPPSGLLAAIVSRK